MRENLPMRTALNRAASSIAGDFLKKDPSSQIDNAKHELGTSAPNQDGYRRGLSIDIEKTLARQTKFGSI